MDLSFYINNESNKVKRSLNAYVNDVTKYVVDFSLNNFDFENEFSSDEIDMFFDSLENPLVRKDDVSVKTCYFPEYLVKFFNTCRKSKWAIDKIDDEFRRRLHNKVKNFIYKNFHYYYDGKHLLLKLNFIRETV